MFRHPRNSKGGMIYSNRSTYHNSRRAPKPVKVIFREHKDLRTKSEVPDRAVKNQKIISSKSFNQINSQNIKQKAPSSMSTLRPYKRRIKNPNKS